jgi:hypothetical protein
MSDAALVGHFALLGLAVTALAAASLRIASRLVEDLDARVLGAVALGAGFAIAEPALIGLTGHGANPWLLTGAAAITWLAARVAVGAPQTSVRRQVAAAWSATGGLGRAAIGALAAFAIAVAAYEFAHPIIGWDGAVYHVAQPAVWIGDGHPGALHQTVAGFPTQAYPKSFEMLVFWATAISRSLAVLVPLMLALDVVAVGAMYALVRRLGGPGPIAALATAAGLLIPWHVVELGNVYNDVAALGFLAVAVTLCLAAFAEPGALGLAVVAAGVAVGIKTTTVPIAVLAVGAALWAERRELRSGRFGQLALGGFGVGLAALWYAADAVVYHAPLWPFSRFPDGPQQPYVWRELSARFLNEPLATVKAVGGHDLLQIVGGIPILLAGVVLVGGAVLHRTNRDVRRPVLIGCGVVALQTLLWAAAPFTGITHSFPPLVVSTIRYLDLSPAAAAVVLAVAARRPGVLRWLAALALAAALAGDLIADHHWLAGQAPRWQICVAAALAGAIAAALSRHFSLHNDRFAAWQLLAPAVTVATVTTFAAPAASYLSHYLAVPVVSVQGEKPILDYLRHQPAWVHGHAPVTAGYAADVSFAGPSITHPLRYLPAGASCAQVQAAAGRGWLILWPLGPSVLFPAGYDVGAGCRLPQPSVTVSGGVRIYPPVRSG